MSQKAQIQPVKKAEPQPDASFSKDGKYTIKNVPDGKYTLMVMHRKAAPASSPVTEEVEESLRHQFSINDEEVMELARYAQIIERIFLAHYQEGDRSEASETTTLHQCP